MDGRPEHTLSRKLEELWSGAELSSASDVQIEDIARVLEDVDPISSSVYDCADLIFSQDKGLLGFLETTLSASGVGDRVLQKVRQNIYQIIAGWIESVGRKGVLDHLEVVVKTTFGAFVTETGSDAKRCSLLPLMELLKTRDLDLDWDLLSFSRVSEELFRTLHSGAKVRPTVKRQVLVVLGYMVRSFPEEFHRESTRYEAPLGQKIRETCLNILHTNIAAEDSKDEKALVEGAFHCLSNVLSSFKPAQDKETEQLYSYVLKGTELKENQTRFAIPEEAAKMLRKCAKLFTPYIIKDPFTVYNNTLLLSRSRHHKVRTPGFLAALQIQKVLGQELATKQDDTKRKVLNKFMKAFKGILDAAKKADPTGQELTNRDIELVINGYGFFAKAILAHTSPADLRRVLAHLKEASSSIDRSEDYANALVGDTLSLQSLLTSSAALVDSGVGADDADPSSASVYSASNNEAGSQAQSTSFFTAVHDINVKRHNARARIEQVLRHARFLRAYARIIVELPAELVDERDQVFLDFVAQEIVFLAYQFPHLFSTDQLTVSRSVLAILKAYGAKGQALPWLLSRIVRPVLLRTCSTVPVDSYFTLFHPDTGLPDGRLVFPYIQLWMTLLPRTKRPVKQDHNKDGGGEDLDAADLLKNDGLGLPEATLMEDEEEGETNKTTKPKNKGEHCHDARAGHGEDEENDEEDDVDYPNSGDQVGQVILDYFIQVSTKIIQHAELDLVAYSSTGSTPDDVELQEMLLENGHIVSSTSGGIQLAPKSPQQFSTFVNLVELWERVLPPRNVYLDPSLLSKWACIVSQTILARSARFPLVPGFYQLMRIVFSFPTSDYYDIANRFLDMCFLRSKQQKDEALNNCLRCLMSTPIPLVKPRIAQFEHAVALALKVGTAVPRLGGEALDALEYWIHEQLLASESLKAILPNLGLYISGQSGASRHSLSSALATNQAASTAGAANAPSVNRSALQGNASVKKRKRRERLERRRAARVVQDATPELLEQRVVKFLGRIGGMNRYVLPSLESKLQDCFSWDTKPVVDIQLTMGFVTLDVLLDNCLPRIVELALHSTKRATKVASCELLHALVLYIIGKHANATQDQRASFAKLFEKLFPKLLALAVDLEAVARQLFRPLVLQIAAWFAHNSSSGNLEVMALLEASMDSLRNRTDGGLRDICAQVIGIFFKWSIKTKAPNENTGGGFNEKSLLRRLYFLMRHPDPYQRLGACLAFDHIYTTFREEQNLVQEFVLELFYHGMYCLGKADTDPPALGTIPAAERVLKRICRIITRNAKSLASPRKQGAPSRRVFDDLHHAIRWLFQQTCRREVALRKMARILFEVFVTTVNQTDGTSVWFHAFAEGKSPAVAQEHDPDFKDNQVQLVSVGGVTRPRLAYERSFSDVPPAELRGQTVKSLQGRKGERIMGWLDDFTGLVDASGWLLRLDAASIVQDTISVDPLRALSQTKGDLGQVVAAINQASAHLRKYDSYRAQNVLSFLVVSANFLDRLLERGYISLDDNCSHLLTFLLQVLLAPDPRIPGLDRESLDFQQTFFPLVERLFTRAKAIGGSSLEYFTMLGTNFVSRRKALLGLQTFDSRSTEFQSVLRGHRILLRCGLNFLPDQGVPARQSLVQAIKLLGPGTNPSTLTIASSALDLCFKLRWPALSVTQEVLQNEAFLTNFQEPVLHFLLAQEHWPAVASLILKALLDPHDKDRERAFAFLTQAAEEVLIWSGTLGSSGRPQLISASAFVESLVPSLADQLDLASPGEHLSLESYQRKAGILLGRLIRLAPQKFHQHASIFQRLVLRCLDHLIGPNATVATKVDACSLLPLLFRGTTINRAVPWVGDQAKTDLENHVLELIQEHIAARHFPLQMNNMSPEEKSNFIILLQALFGALEACGSTHLLDLLSEQLCLGEEHVYANQIARHLRAFVSRVDVFSDMDSDKEIAENKSSTKPTVPAFNSEPRSVQSTSSGDSPIRSSKRCPALLVIEWCTQIVLSGPSWAPSFVNERARKLRQTVLSFVLVPLLQKLSPSSWRAALLDKGAHMLHTIANPLRENHSATDTHSVQLRCSAFDLLQVMYTSLSKVQIESIFADSTKTKEERDKAKDWTRTFLKVANSEMKRLSQAAQSWKRNYATNFSDINKVPGMEEDNAKKKGLLVEALQEQDKLYANSVFQFLSICLSKTQSKEGPFNLVLFHRGNEPFWDALVPWQMFGDNQRLFEPHFGVETNFELSQLSIDTLMNEIPDNGLPVRAFRMASTFSSTQPGQFTFAPTQVVGAGVSGMLISDAASSGSKRVRVDSRSQPVSASSRGGGGGESTFISASQQDVEENEMVKTLMQDDDVAKGGTTATGAKAPSTGSERKPKSGSSNSNSSLGDEELSSYGSTGTPRAATDGKTLQGNKDTPTQAPNAVATECDADEEEKLELDPFNQLPCMTGVLAALDVMRKKNLISWTNLKTFNEDLEEADMPAWMVSIKTALEKEDDREGRLRLNVRCFALKVIMNRPTLFAAFAHILLEPCLRVVLDLEEPYKNAAQRGTHYFVRDLCVLIGRWERARPGCCRPPSGARRAWEIIDAFVARLMKASVHRVKSIMTSNLQMLSMLVGIWKKPSNEPEVKGKNGLCVDRKIIIRLICNGKNDRKDPDFAANTARRHAGLLMLGILVMHQYDVLAIPGMSDDGKKKFMIGLANNMRWNDRRLLMVASEVAAGVANSLKPDQQAFADTLAETVNSNLAKWANAKSDESSRYLDCLSSFAIACNTRSSNVSAVLGSGALTKLLGYFRRILLADTVRQCVETFEKFLLHELEQHKEDETKRTAVTLELYGGIRPAFARALSHRTQSADGALSSLRVLRTLVGQMKPQEVLARVDDFLIHLINLARSHAAHTVRLAAYSLLISLFETIPNAFLDEGEMELDHDGDHRGDDSVQSADTPKYERRRKVLEVSESIRAALASGLSDPVPSVRKHVFAFWNQESILPTNSAFRRLVKCLQDVKPDIGIFTDGPTQSDGDQDAMYWVGHVSTLVLSLVRNTPEYGNINRKLFDKPLMECEFNEVSVDASWESSGFSLTQPMTPMFATQDPLNVSSDNAGKSFSVVAPRGFVRATQDASNLLFTPTQLASQFSDGGNMGTQAFGFFGGATQMGPGLGTQLGRAQKRRRVVLKSQTSSSTFSETFSDTGVFSQTHSQSQRAGGSGFSRNLHTALSEYRGDAPDDDEQELDGDGDDEEDDEEMEDELTLKNKGASKKRKAIDISLGGALPAQLERRRFNPGQSSNPGLTQSYQASGGAYFSRKTSESELFRTHALNLRRKRQASERKKRHRKARKVQLYRKYREGELPDVQIALREVVEPLIAVCAMDAGVARELLKNIVRAMCERVIDEDQQFKSIMGIPAHKKFVKTRLFCLAELMSTLQSLLQRSVANTRVAGIVSTIHSLIVILNEYIDRRCGLDVGKKEFDELQKSASVFSDPSLLAESAIAGRCIASGIFAIENTIICVQRQERRLNLDKDSVVPYGVTMKRTWLELLRLYELLGEEDLLGSLLSSATTDRKALVALELQEIGEYKQASEVYQTLISEKHILIQGQVDQGLGDTEDLQLHKRELEHWWKCRTDCLKREQKWKTLLGDVLLEANTVLSSWEEDDETREGLVHQLLVDDDPEQVLPLALWHEDKYSIMVQPYLQAAFHWQQERNRMMRMLDTVMRKVPGSFEDQTPAAFFPVEDRPAFLSRWAPIEVTLFELMRGQTTGARGRVENFLDRFAVEWSAVNDFGAASRLSLLRPLMSFVDVQQFFEHREQILACRWDTTRTLEIVDALLLNWAACTPSVSLDASEVWDAILTTRFLCIKALVVEGEQHGLQELCQSVTEHLTFYSSRVNLAASEAARNQGQFSLAKQYVARSSNLFRPTHDGASKLMISLGLSQFMIWENEVLLLRARAKASLSADVRHRDLEKAAAKAGEFDAKLKRLDSKRLLKALRLKGGVFADLSERDVSFEEKSFLCFAQSIEVAARCQEEAQQQQEEASFHRGSVGDAHADMAVFLDQVLRRKPSLNELGFLAEDGNDDREGIEALACKFIRHVLTAAKHGSTAAIDKIPRMLSVLNEFGFVSSIAREFQQVLEETPPWVFLRWVPQILALLGRGAVGVSVKTLVLKIADAYPQAMLASFNVSYECIQEAMEEEKDEQVRGQVLLRLREVKRALDHPLFDTFLEAFTGLHHPELRMATALRAIREIFSNYKGVEAQKMAQRVWREKIVNEVLLDTKPLVGGKVGRWNRKYAKDHRREMVRRFGEDGALLTKDSFKALMEDIQKKKGPITTVERCKPEMSLSEFSSWLSEFDMSNFGSQFIEVPGQYDMLGVSREPRTEQHALIASFDSALLVMSSKEKPKRIVIRGDDEKEYKFLVKGGDDLRLDQRIEQLFVVMNQFFRKDSACAQRGLQMSTYKVIPFSKDIGLLEWVEETTTMRSIFEEQYSIHPDFDLCEASASMRGGSSTSSSGSSRRKSKGDGSSSSGGGSKATGRKKVALHTWASYKAYLNGMRRLTNKPDLSPHTYALMYKVKRKQCESFFQDVSSSVPDDLLRNYLINLSMGPEGFLAIRQNLARSVGVANVCTYILGIGDRHLDNILFCKKNGSLVHIDFGYSFGFATMKLGVPELAPFRFTPQFSNILKPLASRTLTFQSMVHAMSTLRENRFSLFNVMEVFLNEPLIDWASKAKKDEKDRYHATSDSRSIFTDSSSSSSESVPSSIIAEKEARKADHRIERARLKLEGAHPVAIMSNELRARESLVSTGKRYVELYIDALKACLEPLPSEDPDEVRGRHKSLDTNIQELSSSLWETQKLHVNDQVHTLLRMATEESVLIRQWLGWAPWV